MKKITIVLLCLFSIIVTAQTYKNQAEVLSSGGMANNGDVYSNFGVIGEIITNDNIVGGNISGSIGFIYPAEFIPAWVSFIIPENNLIIFPNPVNLNNLFIEFEDYLNSDVHLSIINIYGKLIYKTSLPKSEKKHKINVSYFQSGVYLIKLQTQKGTITKKISIIH